MNRMKEDLARVRARNSNRDYDRLVERVPAGAKMPGVTAEDRQKAAALRARRNEAEFATRGR